MLNKQATRDKQLLAWDRERRRLRTPSVRLLAEPIQKGWKRHFVLTREATVRPDAEVIAAILHEINTTVYHGRKDFQPSRRQLRFSRGMLSSEHTLSALCLHAWDKELFPEQWRGYFRLEPVPRRLILRARRKPEFDDHPRDGRWYPREGYILGYIFRFPRLFTLVTVRHWLTHVRELEPEVETRRAELEGYIHRNSGNHRLGWLLGTTYHRAPGKLWYEKALREQDTREMRAELGPRNPPGLPGATDALPPPSLFRSGGTPSAAPRGETGQSPGIRRHRLPGGNKVPAGAFIRRRRGEVPPFFGCHPWQPPNHPLPTERSDP